MLKTVVTIGGGGGGGNGTVTSVTAGTGLDGGTITTSGTISLANTAVSAGTYGSNGAVSQVTIDAQGRITSASNVGITLPVANVTNAVSDSTYVLASGLLTGGGALTGNVTISLTSVPSGNVSGLGTMATQDANNVNITGGSINTTAVNTVATTGNTVTFAVSSLPLIPEGYITINLNGVAKKIPYYGV